MAKGSTDGSAHASRRRALVTGASSGIGEAFAERLAGERYNLVLVARNRTGLEHVAQRLRRSAKIEIEVLAADLTRPAQLEAVEKRVASNEAIELLVNNAGFGTFGRFAELDPDQEDDLIRLNIVALMRLTRAALPGMVARGHGAIINVSSLASFQPGPYSATYGATKAFVNSFTEAIYEELRGTGVRVQALCPGFTRTQFQERARIDASAVPAFAWMSSEAVVDASLAALRRGELLCVPGLANWTLATLAGMFPRGVARRVAGLLVERSLPR